MRKPLAIGLSIVMATTMLAESASAQGAPSVGGSCGYAAGSYGLDALSPIDIRNPNRGLGDSGTVSRVHFQATYSGVVANSRHRLLVYPGSLSTGPDLASVPAELAFTPAATTGTFASSLSTGSERGATRFGKKGTTSNKSRSGRNGGTSSASTGTPPSLYYFQVWAGDQMIGGWRCALADQ